MPADIWQHSLDAAAFPHLTHGGCGDQHWREGGGEGGLFMFTMQVAVSYCGESADAHGQCSQTRLVLKVQLLKSVSRVHHFW